MWSSKAAGWALAARGRRTTDSRSPSSASSKESQTLLVHYVSSSPPLGNGPVSTLQMYFPMLYVKYRYETQSGTFSILPKCGKWIPFFLKVQKYIINNLKIYCVFWLNWSILLYLCGKFLYKITTDKYAFFLFNRRKLKFPC